MALTAGLALKGKSSKRHTCRLLRSLPRKDRGIKDELDQLKIKAARPILLRR